MDGIEVSRHALTAQKFFGLNIAQEISNIHNGKRVLAQFNNV